MEQQYPAGAFEPQAGAFEPQGYVYDAHALGTPESLAPQPHHQHQETLVPQPQQHRQLHPSLYIAALVLGILSFVVFWPLCFVGLALAWRAMKKINRDQTHPNYAVVRAAVIVNTVSLILGIVLIVIALMALGIEWLVLQRTHNYRLVQTLVVEGSKRMMLR